MAMPRARGEVELFVILNDPAALLKKRVDLLAREFFRGRHGRVRKAESGNADKLKRGKRGQADGISTGNDLDQVSVARQARQQVLVNAPAIASGLPPRVMIRQIRVCDAPCHSMLIAPGSPGMWIFAQPGARVGRFCSVTTSPKRASFLSLTIVSRSDLVPAEITWITVCIPQSQF